ncbi:MAG TPA: hypothetical protein VLL25_10150 [Acidimicrobiales bacterium]|nr:hypothetical protein [Acidimicrobiales bacterium]
MSTSRHEFHHRDQVVALMSQRHMLQYGTSEKELGHAALACRTRANGNPAAQMYGRQLSMDDCLAAVRHGLVHTTSGIGLLDHWAKVVGHLAPGISIHPDRTGPRAALRARG